MSGTIKLKSSWDGGFTGKGRIEADDFAVDISIPAEFGGSNVGAKPKELFVSATAACFIATLRAITENKKIPVETLSVITSATMDSKPPVIEHTAQVLLKQTATDKEFEAAGAAIQAADKNCVVGNIARQAGIEINAIPNIQQAIA